MKKLFLAVLLLAGLAACTDEGNKVDALQTEVLELHDSAMVKIDVVYAMIDDLKTLQNSVDGDSLPADPAFTERILDAITQLRKADDAMMDWMAAFEPVKEDAPAAESLNYLEKQQLSIREVDQMIDNSLSNGKRILSESR